jgi:hypothetical protein
MIALYLLRFATFNSKLACRGTQKMLKGKMTGSLKTVVAPRAGVWAKMIEINATKQVCMKRI